MDAVSLAVKYVVTFLGSAALLWVSIRLVVGTGSSLLRTLGITFASFVIGVIQRRMLERYWGDWTILIDFFVIVALIAFVIRPGVWRALIVGTLYTALLFALSLIIGLVIIANK